MISEVSFGFNILGSNSQQTRLSEWNSVLEAVGTAVNGGEGSGSAWLKVPGLKGPNTVQRRVTWDQGQEMRPEGYPDEEVRLHLLFCCFPNCSFLYHHHSFELLWDMMVKRKSTGLPVWCLSYLWLLRTVWPWASYLPFCVPISSLQNWDSTSWYCYTSYDVLVMPRAYDSAWHLERTKKCLAVTIIFVFH